MAKYLTNDQIHIFGIEDLEDEYSVGEPPIDHTMTPDDLTDVIIESWFVPDSP